MYLLRGIYMQRTDSDRNRNRNRDRTETETEALHLQRSRYVFTHQSTSSGLLKLNQYLGVFPAGDPQLPTQGAILPGFFLSGHWVHQSCVAGSYIFSLAVSQKTVATSVLRRTETRMSGRSLTQFQRMLGGDAGLYMIIFN